VLLFRSTCRNAFSLSRCGRGCVTCAAEENAGSIAAPVPATQLEFASLMVRHLYRAQDVPAEASHDDVACA